VNEGMTKLISKKGQTPESKVAIEQPRERAGEGVRHHALRRLRGP
jgi:hypothetical protein